MYFSAEQDTWDDLGVADLGGGGDEVEDVLGQRDLLPGGDEMGQLRGGEDGMKEILESVGGEQGLVDQLAPVQGGDTIEDGYLQCAINVVTGRTPIFVDPGVSGVADSSRTGADWFWPVFCSLLGLLALL